MVASSNAYPRTKWRANRLIRRVTLAWRTAVIGCLLVSIGLAAHGHAAHAAGPDDLAQQLFREGVEAARQERWTDARTAFEKAYAISPRPVVLINLAGAQARTGQLQEAAAHYHRILDDRRSAETAPFRQAAADILPALEARIPKVRLHASGLGAADVVEIDGQTVEPDQLGESHSLDPGTHTIVVKRSGIERARVAFSIAERESHDISLPAAAVAPTLGLGAPVPSDAHLGISLAPGERSSTPQRSHSSWLKSPWLWAGVVAAAAAVVIGGLVVENRHQPYSGNVPPGLITIM